MNDIKLDKTSKTLKYYVVLKNTSVAYYDTKVLYGGSIAIVQRKIDKQIIKWTK